jgi:uncharacterized membrane protein YdbT with pleckstrin-like domain
MAFKDQLMPDENVIILARQHPLVLFKPIAINVASLAILILLGIYKSDWVKWALAFYIIPLIYFLISYLSWRNREYVLTDRRVVKQEGVFSVSSFDAPLDKINNVYHQQSFFGRLLKYGEVGLETASEQGTTTFSFLANPLAFKNAIVIQRESHSANPGQSGSRDQSVPRMLEELASLRDRKIITESEFLEKKKSLLGKM